MRPRPSQPAMRVMAALPMKHLCHPDKLRVHRDTMSGWAQVVRQIGWRNQPKSYSTMLVPS